MTNTTTNSVRSFPLPPALLTFSRSVNAIRSVDIDGQPWFVAKDVCAAIGLTNPTVSIAPLLPDERAKKFIGQRETNVIAESGLYKLLLRAQRTKPQVAEFQDWVVRHVLPAVRKDGAYVMGEEKVATGEMSEDEFVLRAIKILQDKLDRLRAEAAKMRDELTIVTVDEWRALRHRYLTPSERLRISGRAKALHLELGVPIGEQWRTYTLPTGRVIDTKLNVYRADLIDRAALYLGIPMVAAR